MMETTFFPEPFARALRAAAVAEEAARPLAEIANLDHEIRVLKARLEDMTARRKQLAEDAREAGTVEEPDERGGRYRLRVVPRIVQTVEPQLLKDRHPDVFNRVAVLTVTCPMAAVKCLLPNAAIEEVSTARTTERIMVEYDPARLPIGGRS